MKKIVLVPNAMKGSLTAKETAEAMAIGIARSFKDIEIVQIPFSDGGDGLVEVFADIFSGKIESAKVLGPRGDRIKARFCLVPEQDMVAIEMAKACGLALLPEEARNPMLTTSYGTGELIASALDYNVSHIIVGLGGSATNDGGVGMASALGARFLDEHGKEVEPIGGELHRIRDIDLTSLDPRLQNVRIEVVCDVNNPLLGPSGASRVYGPQKGATPLQVESLESGMNNLAEVIEKKLSKDVRGLQGGGAAGGLGAGFYAFIGSNLKKGVELMLEIVGLEKHLTDADLIITAEGQFDTQTTYGKGPAGVALCARKYNLPCILLTGNIKDYLSPELQDTGLSAVLSICPGPIDPREAMDRAFDNMVRTTEQIVRIFAAGQEKNIDGR